MDRRVELIQESLRASTNSESPSLAANLGLGSRAWEEGQQDQSPKGTTYSFNW